MRNEAVNMRNAQVQQVPSKQYVTRYACTLHLLIKIHWYKKPAAGGCCWYGLQYLVWEKQPAAVRSSQPSSSFIRTDYSRDEMGNIFGKEELSTNDNMDSIERHELAGRPDRFILPSTYTKRT